MIRAAHAPPSLDRLLSLEERAHGDVLRVPVAWNETRLKGPVLSFSAWLAHAADRYPAARFIAKMDDDAYVHAPRLEDLLHATLAQAVRPDRVYMGSFSWFNWLTNIFERTGYGWAYTMAFGAVQEVDLAMERAICS